MNVFVSLLAPVAMLLPAFGNDDPRDQDGGLTEQPAGHQPGIATETLWSELTSVLGVAAAKQVRIEQRVILRISPWPEGARQNLVAALPVARGSARLVERPFGECLSVGNIAAVQAQRGNRLLLYLRDRRLIAAHLEKACSAQNYYSGFYLERNEDGRLCVSRDRLQARNGTKCSVSALRQIVAVAED